MKSDQPLASLYTPRNIARDLASGLVVFLVALPLCLGIALASGAPLFSGLIAGIVGGLVVGALSGSHTSVSGPAAGLTAIVATQIASLGSFEAFLVAVMIGGVLQVGLGLVKAGSLSSFFPSSVIKGLLAAIGVILILKQIPHLFGDDDDPAGELAFQQMNNETTLSELMNVLLGQIHVGAMVVGLMSVAFLFFWEQNKKLKNSIVPGPLVVVLVGVAINVYFRQLGSPWRIDATHLVQIPVAGDLSELVGFMQFPDFSALLEPTVYVGGVTIAIVASLETLLNLQATDKLDPEQRFSPPSRELLAQGAGNIVCGLVGGLPVTSVIVRSSVNITTGVKTKLSSIFHGGFLLVSVVLIPVYMNYIPLASLAAILFVTGFKLASPNLFRQMYAEGRYQFTPFIVTLLAIVFTDLLIGIGIGLFVSVLFILNSNVRRPIRQIVETHRDSKRLRIELANQVSFLNRAALDRIFDEMPRGSHLLIDASATDYIDPDVLSMIRDFKARTAPARNISLSLVGFRDRYQLDDEILFADYTTRELQEKMSPRQALEILLEGNRRFQSGQRLAHDLGTQINATAGGQNPFAAVLSCIDSRVPAEIVFDLGIGDIFSVRLAGNVLGDKALGSLEYAVAVARSKLILVMGHTRCGAVTASVDLVCADKSAADVTGCGHLHSIVSAIEPSVEKIECQILDSMSPEDKEALVNDVARRNVLRTVEQITEQSEVIRQARDEGRVMVVGAIYHVTDGSIEMLTEMLPLEA